jgi:hypothetical protein
MRRPDPAPLVAAALALTVYLATLHPGLPAGDSGELIVVAHDLGVAHPPGYPLYTWLGHALLAAVPWGSPAWRLNLLSALLGAAAVGVLAHTVQRWTGSRAGALLAAGALAFAPPVWKTSLVAEVFALNTLMACVVFACVVRLASEAQQASAGSSRPLVLFALLAVLAASHHHSLVLMLVPSAALLAAAWLAPSPVRRAVGLPHAPFRLRARHLAGVALAAGAAALPLLHLPWASDREAWLRWGATGTFHGWLRHLLRAEYGTLSLAPEHLDLAQPASHAWLYLKDLVDGPGAAVVALALLGAGWGLARTPRRAPTLALLGLMAGELWFLTRAGYPGSPIHRGVVERFHALPQVAVAALAGAGAAWLLARVPAPGRPAAAVALPTALVLLLMAHALPTVDQRGNHTARELVEAVLASLPRDGVLFVRGDLYWNGLAYLQAVEGRRSDAVVVSQDLLGLAWYRRQVERRHPGILAADAGARARPWSDGLIERRPVCFLGRLESGAEPDFEAVPRGLLTCAHRPGAAPSPAQRLRADLGVWAQVRPERALRPQDPRSFEATERRQLLAFAARTAIDLCQPGAQMEGLEAASRSGLERLDAFLRRHRALGAADPLVLWADGMLRLWQPALHDPQQAARAFGRLLALHPESQWADDARRALAAGGVRP